MSSAIVMLWPLGAFQWSRFVAASGDNEIATTALRTCLRSPLWASGDKDITSQRLLQNGK